VLARLLAEAGCVVDGPLIIPDGDVSSKRCERVTAGYRVIVTTAARAHPRISPRK